MREIVHFFFAFPKIRYQMNYAKDKLRNKWMMSMGGNKWKTWVMRMERKRELITQIRTVGTVIVVSWFQISADSDI